MRKTWVKGVVLAAAAVAFLGGCTTLHQNAKDMKAAKHQMRTAQRPKPDNTVQSSNNPYLAGSKVQIKHSLPDFFKRKVVLVLGPSTLPAVAAQVSQVTGVPVYVASDAMQALYQGVRFAQLSKTALNGNGGQQQSG
ncbi:MAG TPA: hypothetical protein VFA48_08360, partial [Gammaproteobacteria bacterium]|nr:hypothetical protein [Gammaproteobacteria bacterium]